MAFSNFRFARAVGLLTTTFCASLLSSNPVLAACSSPLGGKWMNAAGSQDDPGSIDVVCSGNTRFGVTVWVLQSNGQWYARPRVPATSDGNGIQAKVYTGGYQDHLNIRYNNGWLEVSIFHKSLDSKPDAFSQHWYKKVMDY
jgi:hypothetical protein